MNAGPCAGPLAFGIAAFETHSHERIALGEPDGTQCPPVVGPPTSLETRVFKQLVVPADTSWVAYPEVEFLPPPARLGSPVRDPREVVGEGVMTSPPCKTQRAAIPLRLAARTGTLALGRRDVNTSIVERPHSSGGRGLPSGAAVRYGVSVR
jgi:hypothetical protein